MSFARKWIEWEIIMLSEISQKNMNVKGGEPAGGGRPKEKGSRG
jgi:hypothetical protein